MVAMKYIIRILQFTTELKKYYIVIGIFTIVLAIVAQLQPLIIKAAIDEFTKIINGGEVNLWFIGLMVLFIFIADVLQTLLSNIGGYYGDIMSVRLRKLMSERYYSHLLSLPQRYFDVELSGKIINRMSRGITQITDFMQMMSNNFLQFIFSTVFSLIIVAIYSWEVAIMLATLYPIFIFMTVRTSNKWMNYQTKINRHYDIASGRFAEGISQIKVVKSFIQEKREIKTFKQEYQKATETTYPQSRYWHNQDVFRRLVLNVIFLFVFGYIFLRTGQGVYTIGEMVLLIQYATLIRIPIFSISFLIDRSQRAVSDTKDYFAVMDETPQLIDAKDAVPLRLSKGEIEFDDVTFGYDEDAPVLKKVSFTVKPSTKVALVGESGEGKTTITNLLMRLYDIDKGVIRIDGQSISNVTQQSLRNVIGTVFQDPALFSGTILENISYASPAASKQAVVAAAKAANAHEFIEGFEKGYDTQIGERGLKLSGGQKQRIAIARALLKDAPILILDEATSSLDSRSEQKVQEALEHLMKDRTTIIIAHRLSTIQAVDQIITIKHGKVNEIGSPEELASSGGIYQRLLELQSSASTATRKKRLAQYDIAS